MITNRMVFDAINACIETRWAPASRSPDGYLPRNCPVCQLCALFLPVECDPCPLYLSEGHSCSVGKSAYAQYVNACQSGNALNIRFAAQDVVEALLRARAKFFGDWKNG